MPTQAEIIKIKEIISHERFNSCRFNGSQDHETLAVAKWNAALSEALYPCLQALEVGYRNRAHQEIAVFAGGENWILSPTFLKLPEQEMVGSAKQSLIDRGKNLTVGYLIAELRFGFWTSLADSRYERMWPKIIKKMFPMMPNTIRSRPEISKRLNSVRSLRNAVSHHHSIWHWADLEQKHKDIRSLLAWIDPVYAKWIYQHDRFPSVFAAKHAGFI